MAKTIIKQPNLMGNIGQNFAAGLAQQAPKEMEQYRLSRAMENVKNMQGASPFEQFAAVAPFTEHNGVVEAARYPKCLSSVSRTKC